MENTQKASLGLLVRSASHELTILYGAAVPLLTLLIFWVAGASLNTAVIGTVYVADATIIGAEILIGWRADLRGAALAGQAAIGAVLGVLVLALRLLLH